MVRFGLVDGYETWGDKISRSNVRVHQLLAISEGESPEKVFSKGEYVVHHKNGVPWDNRPENIELLTNSEHSSLHAQKRDYDSLYDEWNRTKPWFDEAKIRKLYHDEGLTAQEISDKLGCSQKTIIDQMKRYNIERRSRGRQPVSIPRERLKEYLLDPDQTQQDLADEYDTTTVTVRTRLREAGF